MFSKISRRLTYANVAATLALVFAMSGGAYAASKYLITSTKQISPKVLKSLVGKAGPAGANGSNGANGAAGEKGAQGPQGPAGVGTEGKEGPAGKEGKEGPVGKTGANGQTGFTETLPAGKTETGTWGYAGEESGLRIPISFPIPLEIKVTHVRFVLRGETGKGCSDEANEPTAEPGYLCIYGGSLKEGVEPKFQNPEELPTFVEGVGKTGALMLLAGEPADEGTWAVTAPIPAP
ncbi:MAG TPA: hypothetical protein VK691_07525 [Solirubrobacteraceae bacterium]|nr:hypothetical protein [Solirubrobacteraceae bacterium]